MSLGKGILLSGCELVITLTVERGEAMYKRTDF